MNFIKLHTKHFIIEKGLTKFIIIFGLARASNGPDQVYCDTGHSDDTWSIPTNRLNSSPNHQWPVPEAMPGLPNKDRKQEAFFPAAPVSISTKSPKNIRLKSIKGFFFKWRTTITIPPNIDLLNWFGIFASQWVVVFRMMLQKQTEVPCHSRWPFLLKDP